MAWRYLELENRDYLFIGKTLAPEYRDHEDMANFLKNNPSLLESMLDDEKQLKKLFEKVMGEEMRERILTEVSPRFLFNFLIRQAQNDLKKEGYTIERIRFEKIPVFDSGDVVDLLNDRLVRNYLVDVLSSYTRVKILTLPLETRERMLRKYGDIGRKMKPPNFSTIKRVVKYGANSLNVDSLIGLYKIYEFADDERGMFDSCKWIGDACLFILGMFPEYVESEYLYPLTKEIRPTIGKQRKNMEEYEAMGKEFYRIATKLETSKEMGLDGLDEILYTLSEKFSMAKKTYNYISERYVSLARYKWFAPLEGIKDVVE